MSFTNFQKTIALSGGVLVLSGAIALVAVAWTGPSVEAPLGNASAPLNTGASDQVKTGGLTVKELSLDDGTGKGDIINADDIIGGNDLFLHSGPTEQAEILLDEDGGEGIKFYTNSTEIMNIEESGDLIVHGLTDCFLQVDNTGKVNCYTGEGIPGGNVLETTQVNVASASQSSGSGCSTGVYPCCDTYTVLTGDVEKVVRVYVSMHSYWTYSKARFWFYINGVEQWYEFCGATRRSYSGSRYYHVIGGDVLKVRVNLTDYGSVGVSGSIYTLGARRDLITHAFSDGNILYWYDQGATGEMSPAGGHYIGANPPTSVIVSAKDAKQVKWILE